MTRCDHDRLSRWHHWHPSVCSSWDGLPVLDHLACTSVHIQIAQLLNDIAISRAIDSSPIGTVTDGYWVGDQYLTIHQGGRLESKYNSVWLPIAMGTINICLETLFSM